MNKRLNIVFKAEYIDVETGECITREVSEDDLVKMLVWKDKTKRRKAIKLMYGEKIMIFQEILKKAVKELKGDELKVFNYMLGIMDFENWINISQKDMAMEIGMHKVNVSKAIKGLREKGYIEVIKKGRENYYRINPEMAWKGNERSHLRVLKKTNLLID